MIHGEYKNPQLIFWNVQSLQNIQIYKSQKDMENIDYYRKSLISRFPANVRKVTYFIEM